MELLSIQILLVNFIVAGIITAGIYFYNKNLRIFNPLLLFIVSSLGSFLGTFLAMLLPDFSIFNDSLLLKNLVFTIPSIILSSLFLFIWIKGSRSEGYF